MSSIIGNNTPIGLHNGFGDNIGGDKIQNVYQHIAPELLRKPIELIFCSIREKDHNTAKIRLEIIKEAGSLNPDSQIILDNLFSIYLGSPTSQEKAKIRSSLISFEQRCLDNVLADLCLATIIRLDVENKLLEDARKRYQKSHHKNSYSHEAFYESVATNEELKNLYEQNRLNLGESELNGIIRGLFRAENFSFALKVAERLNQVFTSFNSQVLLLFCKAIILFNIELNGKHLWLLTAKSKNEVIEITEELINLLNTAKTPDSRLFNIAIPCLYYQTEAHHKTLADICWKNINEIEKVNSKMAAVLFNVYEKNFSKFEDESERKHAQAQYDKKYRNKLLDEIYSLKAISTDDFIILRDFSSKDKIIQWFKSNGIITGEDDLAVDTANLELRLIILPSKNNRIEIYNIRTQAKCFLEKHQNKLEIINPFVLEKITNSLLDYSELSLIACDFLKPLLPSSDLWLSPLVRNYLNALLCSEQMVTLNTVLNSIDKEEWDNFVWQVQARMQEHQDNNEQAILSMEQALNLYSDSLNSWAFLIHLYRKVNASDETIYSVLQRIPEELFLEKSDMGLSLLIEISKTGDFQRAEKIIISWFIKNPNDCAIALTNFHFSVTLGSQKNLTGSERVGDCIVGVRFKKDNEELIKLLVDNAILNNHYFLDVNSYLGDMLCNMNINQVERYGMNDYELLERLPSYVAAFKISVELRQMQNDGSDSFFLFTVPDNPDEMIKVMEDKLSRIQNHSNNEEIIKIPDIPLFFKGVLLDKTDPIKAALTLLSTKDSIKHSLPNFGEESPSIVALDVYAIAYLSVTGLAFALDKMTTKFVITKETKFFIEHWLNNVNREDYMTLSVRPEGGLLRVTAEDIKQSTYYQQIQNALNVILTECEVVAPELVDMPEEIISTQEFLDYSVYSTIKLSISNDIYWLCIDNLFASILNKTNYRIANAFKLLSELGSLSDFENKKEGLHLHALGIIPYPVLFQDLRFLAISNDKHSYYYLSEIIGFYPKAFSNLNDAIEAFSELLYLVLCESGMSGYFSKGLRKHSPSNNGYVERLFNTCCRVCMQCEDNMEAELALAMLLCKLFSRFGDVPSMNKLICLIATEFTRGHFLDIPIINQYIKNINEIRK